MDDLVYALTFRGTVERHGPDGNVLRATGLAPGCALVSRIGDDGLRASERVQSGRKARLQTELIFTGESTFQEFGIVEFGKEGHHIEFSSIGSGFVERTMNERVLRGGAMCRIDRGDGQFAGVRGIVASLFSIDVGSRIMVRHFVIIRGAEPRRR